MNLPTKIQTFRNEAAFESWMRKNHGREQEVWVRIYKKGSGVPSITIAEALDVALCWGWIDGVVRSLDADSFQQRYTPRKTKSNWSRVNIERMRQLIAEGRAAPPGIAAFERRDKIATAPYSFENRNIALTPAFMKRLKANAKAWKFFQSEPPGYRRITIFWVMQAKKAETRERRFRTMLTRMAKGERMGILPQNRNKKRAAST